MYNLLVLIKSFIITNPTNINNLWNYKLTPDYKLIIN